MKNLLTFVLLITGISVQSQSNEIYIVHSSGMTNYGVVPGTIHPSAALYLQPPDGHRWRTNRVTVDALEAELIPVQRYYYVIQPGGALAFIGAFETLAQAHVKVGSSAADFCDRNTAIISTATPINEGVVEWHAKPDSTVAVHDKTSRPTAPPMPTLPVSKPSVKARVTPVIAPSPVRGSTTVSVSGPPGTLVPKRWNWGRNAYLQDCVTDNMVTNAIGFVFDVLSNNTYRVWSAPNLAGPWTEYPMSTNVQPANGNFEWQHCLPLPTDGGQRFYQITSSNP